MGRAKHLERRARNQVSAAWMEKLLAGMKVIKGIKQVRKAVSDYRSRREHASMVRDYCIPYPPR